MGKEGRWGPHGGGIRSLQKRVGLGGGLGEQVPISLELIPVAAAQPSAFQPEHLDSNY